MKNIVDLLTGREGLGGVHALLMGKTMRQELRKSLTALLADDYQIDSCRLQRAKFKPGRKLTAYFDVPVRRPHGQGTAQVRPLEVVWSTDPPPTTPDPPLALEHEALAYGLMAPFQRLLVNRPAWHMRVQLAPLDPRFPHLMRLCAPSYVTTLLGAIKPEMNDGAATIRVIRYRPGQRHVLGYGQSQHDQPHYYAKLYQDDEGEKFYHVAHWLADQLEANAAPVGGLRPLVYQATDKVILYPPLVGVTLAEQLRRPTRHTHSALINIGQALRVLHSAQPPFHEQLPQLQLATEIKTVLRTSEHICCLLPAVGAQLNDLLQRAAAALTELPHEPATFVHGDMKADHLFLHATGLTLFDFDACALADPAVDLGKFLADLCWWYSTYQNTDLSQAQAALLQGYGLPLTHPRLQRAWHYAVIALLKMTAHRVPLFASNWATCTGHMIEQSALLNSSGLK